MRLAIFFTPPPEHPLTGTAALWLGRDAISGEEYPRSAADLSPAEVEALTAAPRRYGFHATLKPPFRPVEGCGPQAVEQALEDFCRRLRPIDLGRLRIAAIGSFFALAPSTECGGINHLAAETVRRFDGFRAPPTDAEIAARRPDRLTARQRDNLDRWGYPYVFGDFRFHMTLTGPVAADRRAAVSQVLERRFRPLLDAPLVVDGLALFVEPSPPGDFFMTRRVAFGRTRQPVDAV